LVTGNWELARRLEAKQAHIAAAVSAAARTDQAGKPAGASWSSALTSPPSEAGGGAGAAGTGSRAAASGIDSQPVQRAKQPTPAGGQHTPFRRTAAASAAAARENDDDSAWSTGVFMPAAAATMTTTMATANTVAAAGGAGTIVSTPAGHFNAFGAAHDDGENEDGCLLS
jgi:hypothetical protein